MFFGNSGNEVICIILVITIVFGKLFRNLELKIQKADN
jgi:hypothetical protein